MQDSFHLEAEAKPALKTIALITTSLVSFFTAFVYSGISVATPVINREFHPDAILLTWLVTAPALTLAVLLLSFGRLADILGIKRIYITGLIIFTLSSSLSYFSSSIMMLLILQVLQAIGGAMIFGNSTAMLAAIYPSRERGKALGISIACVYLGLSAGPFLGGVLIEHFGWRSLFSFTVPFLALVISWLAWKVKGEWCACKGEQFDLPGSIVYGFSLIALISGFSMLPDLNGGLIAAAGIVGLIFFYRWETHSPSPLINMNIFRHNRIFLLSNLAALFSYLATFAIVFLLSLYLQDIRGYNPETAGFILVAQPVIMALISPFSGRLSDKIEPRILASIGMALIFVGLLFFSLFDAATPILPIVLALAIIGMGFAFFSAPNTNAIMNSAGQKFYGVAAATMSTMRNIGQTLSMSITMIIMGLLIGREIITPERYPALMTSTKVAFGIFAFFCFIGIFASIYRGKVR